MENKLDSLFFNRQFVPERHKFALMADANLKFASPCREERSGMEDRVKNNTPKQPNPYRIDRLALIPVPVKAVLIKFWFAGAVYFFIGLGIASLNTVDQLDLVLVLGIVLGMVTDLLVNSIFRYLETDKADFAPYMVFGKKKFMTFFLNIVYNILLSVAIAYTYHFINLLAGKLGWVEQGGVWLTAEPLLYGAFYLMYDFLVLGAIALVRKLRGLPPANERKH